MTDRTRTYRWNDPAETVRHLAGSSGLAFVQGMRTGEVPTPPFAATLGFGHLTSVAEGPPP